VIELEATIVCADLSGFTLAARDLDPEQVTELVNGCFAGMEDIASAHGGTPLQFLGDCMLAAFPHSEQAESANRHALAAALEMLEWIKQSAPLFPGGKRPGLHIGVEAGQLQLGRTPSGGLLPAGRCTTAAMRLEAAAETGSVLVGSTARQLARRGFSFSQAAAGTPQGSALLASGQTDDRDTLPAGMPRLPESTADEQMQHRRLQQRQPERRQVTVLFAELCQAPAPSDAQMQALTLAVQAEGGYVDKFTGRTMMALFGAPDGLEEAPARAAAALARLLSNDGAGAIKPGTIKPGAIRAGMNSGLVVAGSVGGNNSRQYTVIGDAVNLAARLKDAASPGELYLGEQTAYRLSDRFRVSALAPLSLQGQGRAVQAYSLDPLRPPGKGNDAGPRRRKLRAPLVGRDQELAALLGGVKQAHAGEGSVMVVSGEAGLGKSRLLEEFKNDPSLSDCLLLESQASQGNSRPFALAADLLREWCQLSGNESNDDALALLRAALERSGGQLETELPSLATLLGIQYADENSPGSSQPGSSTPTGDALRKRLQLALTRLATVLSAQQPLVIVLEDLHWADQSSIEILGGLLTASQRAPVVTIITTREDSAAALTGSKTHKRSSQLALSPLDDNDLDRLVTGLLGTAGLPIALRRRIRANAEGNPFYVEEVLRSFIDQGALVQSRDGWQTTAAINEVDVPDSVQGVVLARVDAMDDQAREILQAASVIGRRFYHRLLLGTVDDSSELDTALARLEDMQLVGSSMSSRTGSVARRADTAEREYHFHHQVAQQTVYQSLLKGRRRDMHARVAGAIEKAFERRLDDFEAELAFHWGQADQADKAEYYLFRAGDNAARSAASAEALTHFREASRLYLQQHGKGGDRARKALLEKNIGLALLNTGDHHECIEHFDASLAWWGRSSSLRTGTAGLLQAGGALARTWLALWRRRGNAAAGKNGSATPSAAELEGLEAEVMRAQALVNVDPQRAFTAALSVVGRLEHMNASGVERAAELYADAAGFVAFSGASFSLSRRLLERGEDLLSDDNFAGDFACRAMRFIADYFEGNWNDSPLPATRDLETAMENGQLVLASNYFGLAAERSTWQGHWRNSARMLDAVKRLVDLYGYDFAVSWRDAIPLYVAVQQDRPFDAIEAANRYLSARHEDNLLAFGHAMKARAECAAGYLDEAARSIELSAADASRAGALPPYHAAPLAVARFELGLMANEREHADSPSRWTVERDCRRALRATRALARERPDLYRTVGQWNQLCGRRQAAMLWYRRSLDEARRLGALPALARTLALCSRLTWIADPLPDPDQCREQSLSLAECLRRNDDRDAWPPPGQSDAS
jgi:class 3 adenylate cyclase